MRVRIPLVVLGPDGRPLEGATMVVRDRVTGTTDTVYADETGGAALTAPEQVSDELGRLPGWTGRGRKEATITPPPGSGMAPIVEAWDASPAGDADVDADWIATGGGAGLVAVRQADGSIAWEGLGDLGDLATEDLVTDALVDDEAAIVYTKLHLVDSVKVSDTAKDEDGLAAQSFGVYLDANQGPAIGWRRVNCNAELFDVSGVYANAVNYRFQPAVKGVYRLAGIIQIAAGASDRAAAFYKNGTEYMRWYQANDPGVTIAAGGCLIPMNGTTDYVELWAYTSANLSLLGAVDDPVTCAMFGELVGRQA